jgi:hypothetical protein
MLFILGCIGGVLIGALLIGLTLVWLAFDNAYFSERGWIEWWVWGDLSFRVYCMLAGVLLFVGYWIGRATGMW